MSGLPVIQQLIELLRWLLVTLHDLGLQPWGLSIIGVTVIVRLVLFPLTWKQYRSAQAMQALQPQLKALQKKYKSDRGKLQQETMRLYQENRVNPLASCLPILLQLPVFIALYYSIRGADYLDAAVTKAIESSQFLWFTLGEHGTPGTYVLLAIYVASQVISTELSLASQSDPQQKWIMRAMPFIFVFILFNFPAGLFVYWITTNLWTIGQQLLIRRLAPATLATDGKGGDKRTPRKRSRWLDAMMQAQESRMETRKRRAVAAGGADDDESAGAEAGDGPPPRRAGAKAKGGAAGGKAGGKAGASGKAGAGASAGQSSRKSRQSRPGVKPRGGKQGGKQGGKRPPGKGKKRGGDPPRLLGDA